MSKNACEQFKKVLSAHPSCELREGQISMFESLIHAYEENQTILIEAGTGIGKSLAYLVAAILWTLKTNEPTVIATHTIALQEQLIQKDIPFILNALNLELKAVLVKGMNNYLCLRKFHDSLYDLPDALKEWAKQTTAGSKSELPILPSAELWENVGADIESCSYSKCPYYKECFFFKARKEAEDAHIIVANHHLLFADLAVRDSCENYDKEAILPAYQRVVIDEAHHAEDVATHYFADKMSKVALMRPLAQLLSDRGAGKMTVLYRKVLEVYPAREIITEEITLTLPAQKRRLVELVNDFFDALSCFFNERGQEDKLRLRQKHLDDPFWQEQIQTTAEELIKEGKNFIKELLRLERKIKEVKDPHLENKCEGALAEISALCMRLDVHFETLAHFIFLPLQADRVRWIEGRAPNLHLIAADLEIAPKLSNSLFKHIKTIALCSATLATQGNFSFIRQRLGIKHAEEKIYPSPFDYKAQALLALPTDLPDPSHPAFTHSAAEKIWDILQLSEGGAFVLFTSYHHLKECQMKLSERLNKEQFNLLCQGEQSRSHLLEEFRKRSKAVLFGTDSFWEGVDVAGKALRCVIIVKLPFKVPSDPLFEARCEHITEKGGSAFFDYSLPQAIVKFKQGFGRLIRSKTDRGCIVCLDNRLLKKGYGKKFFQSLPLCDQVEGDDFLNQIKKFLTQKEEPCYSPENL